MPRIVRFHQLGGPEVLKLEEAPLETPGPGQVRLKVKALGLNRAEAMYRENKYIYPPKLPSRLGYEAAGVIDAVGPDVRDYQIGDRVSLLPTFHMTDYGVYGETTLAPVEALAKIPDGVSDAAAAAAWIASLTAWGALVRRAQVKKGDFVLITAASSSVGYAAAQVVNAAGGIPIAATRTAAKVGALEAGGFAHVIVTDEQDVAARAQEITAGHGADIVFDPIGGPGIENLAAAAAKGATIYLYGSLSGKPTPFPQGIAVGKGLAVRGYNLFEFTLSPEGRAAGKKYVLEGLARGTIKPLIDKTFPLDQIVEAHRYLESNQQNGKIVVTP